MIIGKKKLLLFTLLWISLYSCVQKKQNNDAGEIVSTSNIELISPDDFNKIDEETLLIDVRTPEEFASGHIKNAINIDFKNQKFKNRLEEIDTDQEVYIYCRSGGRSGRAAKMMQEMGFKKIYDLEGGILNWEKNGYNTNK